MMFPAKRTRAQLTVEEALAVGAPWAMPNAAELVIVVAEARGASTDVAEAGIASHPCAVSFNEGIEHDGAPVDYDEYNSKGTKGTLKMAELVRDDELYENRKEKILEFLTRARANYCADRPLEVKRVCGDVCVVAVKVHDTYVMNRLTGFKDLLSSNRSRLLIVERDVDARYCSLHKSSVTHNWAHNPEQHEKSNFSTRGVKCPSHAPSDFKQMQLDYYDEVRKFTRANAIPRLEIPFEWYVQQNPDHTRSIIQSFAGLLPFPPQFKATCTAPWCKHFIWPVVNNDNSN